MTFGSAFISVNGEIAVLPVAQDQPGRFDVSGCHRAMTAIGYRPEAGASRRRYGRRLFLPVFVDNGQNDRFHDFVADRNSLTASFLLVPS